MVNWRSHITDATLDLSLAKLTSLLCGIYIWEWAQSIGFDLNLFQRGKDKSRWTKWVYLLCRYLTLTASVITVALDGGTRLGCKQYLQLVYGFALASIFLASTLIAIRAVAIWTFDKRASALVVAGLLLQLGFSLDDLVQLDSVMDPALNVCVIFRSATRTAANSTAVLTCDIILFSTMLVGLLRHRISGGFGLWHFLWHQGLIWVALAAIAEIPAIVFLFLDLDVVLDEMFLYPKLFIIVVAATRMSRGLRSFAQNYDPSNNMDDINATDDTKCCPTMHIRVCVNQTSEAATEYRTARSRDPSGLFLA